MNYLIIDKIIKDALIEDNCYEDITTDSIVDKNSTCSIDLIAKENGVIAGLPIFKRVFDILGHVDVIFIANEGTIVKKGDVIGKISGSTKNILTGERVALNLLQKMSGIASHTSDMVKRLEGTNTKILDTRKTTPNLRIIEKYAVKVGGGYNHRFSLSDGILIKDNHINAAGGIEKAIKKVKQSSSPTKKIEIEVENLNQLNEVLKYEVDIIMLDNMEIVTMKKAVEIINKKVLTEASGNINIENIQSVAETGVDFISCGSITHSTKSLDISMKNLILN